MLDFLFKTHGHLSDRDLLLTIISNQHFLISKLDSLMDKTTFLQAIADLKTEVGGVSTKVDTLEQKINNSPTDVDPDIVAAFQDLKGSVDSLNTKADNTPAAAAGTDSGTTAQ